MGRKKKTGANDPVKYTHINDWFDKKDIDANIVTNGNFRYRYSLSIKFKPSTNRRTNNMIVIAMNPSKADKDFSDDTVNALIRHAYNVKEEDTFVYSGLIVLNVFPLYETKSNKAFTQLRKEVHKSFIKDNLTEIRRIMAENKGCDVIVAWGFRMSRENYDTVSEILNICKENGCNLKTIFPFYPIHPQFSEIDFGLGEGVMRLCDFSDIEDKFNEAYGKNK